VATKITAARPKPALRAHPDITVVTIVPRHADQDALIVARSVSESQLRASDKAGDVPPVVQSLNYRR